MKVRQAIAAAVAVLLLTTACWNDDPPKPASLPVSPDLYVNPDTTLAADVAKAKAESKKAEANLLAVLAEQPTAQWVVGGVDQLSQQIDSVTTGALKQNRLAVFVAYNIPNRDCQGYSGGGAANAAEYRTWVDEFAKRIEARRTWVILEPDAVAHSLTDACRADQANRERLDMLAYAVQIFKKAGARVYVDAGHAGWLDDFDAFAAQLVRAGVEEADGFALNVSNFQTTDASIAYGTQLSQRLSGAHFVVDTSRNGRGPDTNSPADQAWCNPPGRAIGQPPTLNTGNPLVDAYLWAKVPGESDGECRPGAPAAGEFWRDYALELIRNRP